MNRFQRRLHLVLWVVVLPACLALVWFGMHAETADDTDFRTVPIEGASE